MLEGRRGFNTWSPSLSMFRALYIQSWHGQLSHHWRRLPVRRCRRSSKQQRDHQSLSCNVACTKLNCKLLSVDMSRRTELSDFPARKRCTVKNVTNGTRRCSKYRNASCYTKLPILTPNITRSSYLVRAHRYTERKANQ